MKDPLLFRWRTLSEPRRRFITTALRMRRPRSEGLDVVVPKLDWRAVGSTCGMSPDEADETARLLSEWGLIRVLSERDFVVVTEGFVKDVPDRPRPWWRRWWG